MFKEFKDIVLQTNIIVLYGVRLMVLTFRKITSSTMRSCSLYKKNGKHWFTTEFMCSSKIQQSNSISKNEHMHLCLYATFLCFHTAIKTVYTGWQTTIFFSGITIVLFFKKNLQKSQFTRCFPSKHSHCSGCHNSHGWCSKCNPILADSSTLHMVLQCGFTRWEICIGIFPISI